MQGRGEYGSGRGEQRGGGSRGGPGGFRSRGPGPRHGGFRAGGGGSRFGSGGPAPGPAPRPDRRVAPPPLRIIHEDESLIVVEKPAGMALSVPPGRDRRPGTMTLQDQVLAHVREQGGRKAGAWGVHELDREISGIVVFARSPAAAESIRGAFAAKKGDAIYLGVVGGVIGADAPALESQTPRERPDDQGGHADAEPESPELSTRIPGEATHAATGTVRTFLRRVGTHVESIPVDEFSGDRASSKRPEAPRLAITHYRVVAGGRGRTMVRLRVKNPRMHQARVHMRDLGHAVVGDAQYGSTEISNRVLLHLAEIAFPHPVTHAPVRLLCPAPALFWDAIGAQPPDEAAGRARKSAAPAGNDDNRGWEHVAEWYDSLVSDKRSDLQDQVVTPGVLRLLAPRRDERIIDVACGPGGLVRTLAAMGVHAVGVDAAPTMIDVARERSARDEQSEEHATPRFEVCDARSLADVRRRLAEGGDTRFEGGFDAACCVLALMNIDPLAEVAAGIASLLTEGGRFVGVILHPAFRSPGMTSWGWAEQAGSPTGRGAMLRRQYRRVDAYLGEQAREVVMNPGAVAKGGQPVVTLTHHRPIGAYVAALAGAGLLVDAIEEWSSHRKSESGPRAAEEDRARREIPMFLAVRAVKPAARPR